MEIKYKQPGSGSDWTTLVDANNLVTMETFRPKATISKQNAPLATTANQVNSSYKQALGNVTTSFSMRISANYASNAAAVLAQAVLTLALSTSKNHLQVTESSGTPSVTIWYANAICTSIEPDVHGKEVNYSIQFECDLVSTTTEPS